MAIVGPDGRALRSFGNFGTRRKVRVDQLEPGMMLCEHILGFRGRILGAEGEVLSQKHVDFFKELCARKGPGCLFNYTREVWVKAALGSCRERPECEEDPEKAVSIQKWYRAGTKLTSGAKGPSAARKRYRLTQAGLQEIAS